MYEQEQPYDKSLEPDLYHELEVALPIDFRLSAAISVPVPDAQPPLTKQEIASAGQVEENPDPDALYNQSPAYLHAIHEVIVPGVRTEVRPERHNLTSRLYDLSGSSVIGNTPGRHAVFLTTGGIGSGKFAEASRIAENLRKIVAKRDEVSE